jgi:hypothetical protein
MLKAMDVDAQGPVVVAARCRIRPFRNYPAIYEKSKQLNNSVFGLNFANVVAGRAKAFIG